MGVRPHVCNGRLSIVLHTENIMDGQLDPADERTETSNATFSGGQSKKNVQWTAITVFIAVLLAFLILLTTAGNLVVCRLVWVCRRMRIPSFYFVASMSFSDFLMGVLVIPISLGYHVSYQTTGNEALFFFTFAVTTVIFRLYAGNTSQDKPKALVSQIVRKYGKASWIDCRYLI